MDLDIETGIELIQKAYEKELNDKLWQRWLVDYARMDDANFINFEDYKEKLSNPTTNNDYELNKTKDEIIAQSEKIITAWRKGGDD